jgi:hypothetical protein
MLCLVIPWYVQAGPEETEFDIERAYLHDGTMFKPFLVEETHSLAEVLNQEAIDPETSVLVMEHPDAGRLALITAQMAYHHVAQGQIDGNPWMVDFCVVCNTGVASTPVVNGKILHFLARGPYDGISIVGDTETGSLWNHITGIAVYGPLKGYRRPVYNLLHTTAKAALEAFPHLEIAISDRPILKTGNVIKTRMAGDIKLSDIFQGTIAKEDDRRPTMDVGLGIWNDNRARYYPMETVIRAGKVVVDALDDRNLVVYVEPASGALAAFYVDSGSAQWAGEVLQLEGGVVYSRGKLIDPAGQQQDFERPMQVFTRWYGFALTFPGTGIYQ